MFFFFYCYIILTVNFNHTQYSRDTNMNPNNTILGNITTTDCVHFPRKSFTCTHFLRTSFSHTYFTCSKYTRSIPGSYIFFLFQAPFFFTRTHFIHTSSSHTYFTCFKYTRSIPRSFAFFSHLTFSHARSPIALLFHIHTSHVSKT